MSLQSVRASGTYLLICNTGNTSRWLPSCCSLTCKEDDRAEGQFCCGVASAVGGFAWGSRTGPAGGPAETTQRSKEYPAPVDGRSAQ